MLLSQLVFGVGAVLSSFGWRKHIVVALDAVYSALSHQSCPLFASPHAMKSLHVNQKLKEAGITTGFQPLKTPEPPDLEGGALGPGGTPSLLSCQHIGFILQYGVAGIVYGSVYRSIYLFLTNYLRMSGIETTSASVLVPIPATLKMFS